ncbi:HYR domain-containing protein, partial [Flavobacterium sp. HTF]|uniref:HYR domain-containing protein n=1 Tax=Flavobacterium sp. HTF TaxID=2170732 RepID=UPI0014028D71
MIASSASAQFYTKHYIAPAPWQYYSDANEIVIATNSTSNVSINVSKSDGTLVTNLTAIKGTPAVYRFTGSPTAATAKAYPFNTVLNGAGLIVTATGGPIAINLRNVASDAFGDREIKGNAALTSFGDAGIGVKYRIGYYRDGSLGNFGNYGEQFPIYTIMAINNGTSIKLNGTVIATLDAGQSYLFKAAIGSLVESSNSTVMNTSAAIDTPNGCGDGAFNQIPPESVLGSEYFIERGKGNDTAEQTTVVATKPNTKLTIDTFSATGTLVGTVTKTLVNAGDFFTFLNGVTNTNFSASRVFATNNVAVYSGTAQSCEVDVSTIAPVSECGGSNFIETAKFRHYNNGSLPYFGYILLKDPTAAINVNGVNIETISGITPRHQLGSTGWYIINFEDTQIGSPNFISVSSTAKMTISIVQQGGGFSMAGFFSNFAQIPEDPSLTYVSGGGCTNSSATLTTPSGFAPYQWFYNGTAISGATTNSYVASKTGSYSVSSTLSCGSVSQSKPVSVTLCTDLGVTKTVDVAAPCVNSNVQFTVKVSNLGLNNATGVSVNDLLPSGYTYVSSVPSTGTYNSATGVWSIGDLEPSAVVTLNVTATVNASGSYNNTASLPASSTDSNPANNSASISTTPKAAPLVLSLTGSTICVSPGGNGTITSSTSVTGVNYQLYNSANVAVQTVKAGTGSGLNWSGLAAGTGYYVIGTNADGCNSKSATVDISTNANPIALALTGSTICVSPGANGTITSSTSVSGVNYQLYNSANVAVQTAKAGTGSGLTWSGISAATGYYVISTNAANCTAKSNTADISTTANPIALVLTGSTICVSPGGNGTITSSTSVNGVNYQLYNSANVAVQAVKAGSGSGLTWTGLAAGTGYYVISTNASTCTATSNTVNISTTPNPTVLSLTGSTICVPANGGAVTSSTSVNGVNYQLYNSGNVAVQAVKAGTGSGLTWTGLSADTGYYVISINAANCTATSTSVTVVNDTQKPTITCPANVTKTTDANSCTATGVVLGTPTTADNCGVASVTNNAPSSYPIGVTTVTWTVTDNSGNTATCSQTVTISDTQKPTITCPANVTKTTDANSCTATGVVLGTPTTADNCGVASVTNNAPSSYPIGVTTVTWTVTDNSGNTATCSQTVTISDTQKPTITCPANVTKTTDANSCTATGVVLGTPTTADNCGVASVTNNAPGSYPIGVTTVTWTVTDNSGNTATCSQTVKIVGPILANNDSVTSFNGYAGGTAVTSVLDNDLLNCNAVNGNDVNITLGTTLPSVLNFNTTTGSVTVNSNTPAGVYTFDYTICEKLNPTNCSTATVSISVSAPTIDAVTETTTIINGNTGGITTSLTANDTLNGNPVVIGTNPGQVKLTGVTVPTGLTLNANGTVTVAANTPAGNYNVEYTICEITNTGNCDTVTSIVTVGAATIDAVTETTTNINGNTGGTTASLTANDTLNGNAVVIGTNPGQVKLTGVTVPTGLTLNANGTVTVAANTPSGNYNVEYTICEITNPGNCDTVTSVVTVGAATIDAVTETTTSINGNTGGTTASLTANDTLNGNPVVIGTNPGQVKLTGVTVPTGLTLNANGTVTVAANTPAGNYNVEYTICEITNTGNCDTVTSVVAVGAATIDAVTETTTSINGNTGGTTASLTANDT